MPEQHDQSENNPRRPKVTKRFHRYVVVVAGQADGRNRGECRRQRGNAEDLWEQPKENSLVEVGSLLGVWDGDDDGGGDGLTCRRVS